MLKKNIVSGGLYIAKVSGKLTTVRVDAIRSAESFGKVKTVYDVTNLETGRKTTFQSAAKFRSPKATESPILSTGTSKEVSAEIPRESSVSSPASVLGSLNLRSSAPPHVIVEALAGTGKTTTLIEGLKRLRGEASNITPSPQQKAVWDSLMLSEDARSVCFVAFNKSIATELQERVPTGCDAMTMHSLGLRSVKNAFQLLPGNKGINGWKVKNIIEEMTGTNIKDLFANDPEFVQATEKLVGLCKMNLLDGDADELDHLTSHYDIDTNGGRARIYDFVPKILDRCKQVSVDQYIDFNDMIWLPVALNLSVPKYDLLLVDESQDLNRCQQELAKKAGKRLVFCGDKNQAIYGFAGADSKSLDNLKKDLESTEQGCVSLPLTVTRRCGKLIVVEAKNIVKSFEAHESNGVGEIQHYDFDKESKNEYRSHVQDGDMIICRVNAPLVSECFRFLRNGRKAQIQGRDIGQGIISTIKKMKATSVVDLIAKISEWNSKEVEKEQAKKNPSESKLIMLSDRHDCILMFCENKNTVEEVITHIERIFTDNRDSVGIKLSSVHKSKGLEADTVFLIEPEGATIPHPMAKSSWEREQEWNLRYVAITRAIKKLVYVR